MKRWIATTIIFLLPFVSSFPLRAEEAEKTDAPQFNTKGFQLGVETDAFVTFASDLPVLPGKVDLTLGYRFNPYFSLSADLWTILGLVYAGEVAPKINFTDSRISPFLTFSVGGGGSLNPFAEEEDVDRAIGFGTYSVGAGVDFHLGRRTTLYTVVKGRGWLSLCRPSRGNVGLYADRRGRGILFGWFLLG